MTSTGQPPVLHLGGRVLINSESKQRSNSLLSLLFSLKNGGTAHTITAYTFKLFDDSFWFGLVLNCLDGNLNANCLPTYLNSTLPFKAHLTLTLKL